MSFTRTHLVRIALLKTSSCSPKPVPFASFWPLLSPRRMTLTTSLSRQTTLLRTFSSNSPPEPGPCPSCTDDNAYFDGGSLFVCVNCGHEWDINAVPFNEEATEEEDASIKDAFGNVLAKGDNVLLIKELNKNLKKGMKVRGIRLGNFGDGHDIEAHIPHLGAYKLKSKFVKKA